MSKERLEMIQKRKKQRRNRQIIKLGLIIVGLVLVMLLIVSGINAAINAVKKAIHTPTPTPVQVISQSVIAQSSQMPKPTSIPDATEENDMLKIIEASQTESKVCYLTFDDGPNKSITPLILDILRKYNIKATFFQVGTLIEEYPDISKRVYEEGHLIGNHSYSHTYDKIYYDKNSFIDEFNKCAQLIQSITGDDYFPIVRFPGGGHNTGKYGQLKQSLKTILAENNVYHCDWNSLNGDAESTTRTSEQLLERVKSTTKNKNKIVLLMHDASSKKQTVNALPAIIEYLISENYSFARLDEHLN